MRAYYDSHDTTVELERSELDESVVSEPMVGITIRLPASALDTARELARERGIKVTALLREWIEQNLGDEARDDRLLSVRDLKSLIAQKSKMPSSSSGRSWPLTDSPQDRARRAARTAQKSE